MSAGDTAIPQSVSETVTGLSPHTSYHARMVASNAAGELTANDVVFTTPFADPSVTGFVVSPSRFRVASRSTAVSARRRRTPRGSAFRFRLNEAAVAKIRVYRLLPGRRSGKRCVAPTRRLRRAKRCTRLLLKGTFTRRRAKKGLNKVAFSGRVGRRVLAAGSYRATIVATKTGALKASRTRTASFKIVTR